MLLRRYFEDFFERYFLPADVFGAEKDFPTSESKMDFFLKESAKIPNIHLLENCMEDGIAGCMGMCDFKYVHAPGTSEILNQMLWSTRWFDGRHWNYMRNNPKRLWEHYDVVLRELSLKKTKIMMSYFLPLEFGMAERYVHDPCSNFFYFHGAPYLENLDDGSIYQAGHTHTAIKKMYVDSQGKGHLLLCNPVGYPDDLTDTVCQIWATALPETSSCKWRSQIAGSNANIVLF